MTSESPFRDAVNADHHTMQTGENGCVEFSNFGLGSDLLAASQIVRNGDVSRLSRTILQRADLQEISSFIILIFVTRNTRGGKGEKKLAYDLFLELWDFYPATAQELLQLFPLYGYWKDLFLLMDASKGRSFQKELEKAALQLIKEQWDKDLAALQSHKAEVVAAVTANDTAEIERLRKRGPNISLLAKWLPREGKSLDKNLNFVHHFVAVLNGDDTGDCESPF